MRRKFHDQLKKLDLARVVFLLTIAFGIFLTGGVFATKQLQPYQFFEDGYNAAKALIIQQAQVRPDLVEEIKYDGNGVTLYDEDRAHNGLTLVQGLFREGVELRLLDMSGRIVNRWPVRLSDIWPDLSHIALAKRISVTKFNYHSQGMWLLPDGAVVFNVGNNIGTVKMDKCGTVEWTVDRMTHHSITHNSDGSFWIPVRGYSHEVPEELLLKDVTHAALNDSRGRYEDRLLLINENGEIEHEISVLRALFEGEFDHDLYDAWQIRKLDPTHINDIEVVTLPLAQKIDGVQTGDLLVSIRQLHMLAIIDRETGRVKWHKTGPWVRQHDPDITEYGNIEVFNNGGDHLNPEQSKGSSVISLDPATNKTEILYPLSENDRFFSRIMGTHQLLANGNRLITESMAGRLFEIDENGEIVWEYVLPYDSSHAALIESAIRYEFNYFSTQDWSCL